MDKQKIISNMDGVLQIFHDDIAAIRTGRATPALIEGLEVSVYGGAQKMKLLELGTIFSGDARSLIFQPWDKSIIGEVKNGIASSGMGFNPIVDNDQIRISLPPLTTEQRDNYVKLLYKKLEAAKVMIRDVRGKFRHELQEQEKEKTISEDEFKRFEEELQKATDEYIAKAEEMGKKKEVEIREQ